VSRLFFVLVPVSVVLLVAIAPAPAAPVPKHLMKPGRELYYPTRVGAKWTELEGDTETASVITNAEEKAGAIHVTVKRTTGTGSAVRDAGTLTVAVSEKGVFRIGVGDHIDNPPWCWLKLPLKSGASWVSQGDRMTASAPEEIETPAGKFLALPVVVEDDNPLPVRMGMEIRRESYTRWFAPGVGLVRQSRGDQHWFVLKSFTPAKD